MREKMERFGEALTPDRKMFRPHHYEMQDVQRRDGSKEPSSIGWGGFARDGFDSYRFSIRLVLDTRHYSVSDRGVFACVGDSWTRGLVPKLQKV